MTFFLGGDKALKALKGPKDFNVSCPFLPSIFNFEFPLYSFGVTFSILNFQFSILFTIFVD